MTDIQRCELRPGHLVEWSLPAPAVAAASTAPEDSRPPAYVQEFHLRTARTIRATGLCAPNWLGTAFDLPGRIDLDALGRALHAWTLRHETLRSGFRWVGDEVRRFTLPAESVSLSRTEVGHFAEPATLVRYLQDRFDAAADALSWPNFLYTAVLRPDGASLYLAFDHSNVDAHSIHRIPAEIHELYAAELRGEVPAMPLVGSYIDFCASERGAADAMDDGHAIVARWREFIARCGGVLPPFPVELGVDPEGPLPVQRFEREMLVDDPAAAAFEAHCRPYGGTLVGVLAATALIVRELGGHEVYRTVVPFHTRVKSRWSDSVGWYVGGAPIEVPVGRAAGFDEALEMVRSALRANRPLAGMPIARALGLLGEEFTAPSPDPCSFVSYVDGRAVPLAEHWAELRAYGLVRVSYGDQVCVWLNRVHEGLQFATRFPDTEAAGASMRRYTERLREMVLSVAQPALATGAPAS
ncbi:condensation domain-containing protein [Streptomyces sp. DSM 44915]|uniref:Condensation domain-containing protein n=1 Tax=Streptomyces chisholmiae TaxID=3075540 RepID=A0ABU2JPZ2_9ACTN|nr:condensation domain-containing protein [Streptomyces sp. DSM 44915]MDT0266803.1 condensation domain-containing protein [Streptomyces sp. DSM 44915]